MQILKILIILSLQKVLWLLTCTETYLAHPEMIHDFHFFFLPLFHHPHFSVLNQQLEMTTQDLPNENSRDLTTPHSPPLSFSVRLFWRRQREWVFQPAPCHYEVPVSGSRAVRSAIIFSCWMMDEPVSGSVHYNACHLFFSQTASSPGNAIEKKEREGRGEREKESRM